MKPSDASSEAIGLRAPFTDRGPSVAARCSLAVAAALVVAAAPGRAAAASPEQITNLADQVQTAVWSQVAGAGATRDAAQPVAVDVDRTVAEITQAALAGADSAAATAVHVESDAEPTGRGAPPEAPRVSAKHPARARLHEKARPRVAAAAASPTVSRPLEQTEARGSVDPRSSKPDRSGTKRSDVPGATPRSRAPARPFDLPSVPLPLALPSSAGAGSGAGSTVPALLVALAAATSLFVSEVLIRRVPSRRPTRPRGIVLPPWRPG
jgi:hypothetical protein